MLRSIGSKLLLTVFWELYLAGKWRGNSGLVLPHVAVGTAAAHPMLLLHHAGHSRRQSRKGIWRMIWENSR
jgi:hypothetical protein